MKSDFVSDNGKIDREKEEEEEEKELFRFVNLEETIV